VTWNTLHSETFLNSLSLEPTTKFVPFQFSSILHILMQTLHRFPTLCTLFINACLLLLYPLLLSEQLQNEAESVPLLYSFSFGLLSFVSFCSFRSFHSARSIDAIAMTIDAPVARTVWVNQQDTFLLRIPITDLTFDAASHRQDSLSSKVSSITLEEVPLKSSQESPVSLTRSILANDEVSELNDSLSSPIMFPISYAIFYVSW
jgi:hypothetical protein